MMGEDSGAQVNGNSVKRFRRSAKPCSFKRTLICPALKQKQWRSGFKTLRILNLGSLWNSVSCSDRLYLKDRAPDSHLPAQLMGS
jgi:hypothetical protein